MKSTICRMCPFTSHMLLVPTRRLKNITAILAPWSISFKQRCLCMQYNLIHSFQKKFVPNQGNRDKICMSYNKIKFESMIIVAQHVIHTPIASRLCWVEDDFQGSVVHWSCETVWCLKIRFIWTLTSYFHQYLSRLPHWHLGNHASASVPIDRPKRLWVYK